MELTNADVVKGVQALSEISGGNSDETELKILRALRVLSPVSEDIHDRTREVSLEYLEVNNEGERKWKDFPGFQKREGEILALESGVSLEDVPTFTKDDFKKLPPARDLLKLGPLFEVE